VLVVGSALIALHLFALAVHSLAASSGPWPTTFGSSPALPPAFAGDIDDFTGRYYLSPLQMTHNAHFTSNAPELPAVTFEVRLKDADGKILLTRKFPDPDANAWLRHRQTLLAQALGDDRPVQAPQGEQVLPKGQQFPTIEMWWATEGNPELRLKRVSLLEVPRNRPTSQPSPWSVLLARAYVRHLCREHHAASAELVRTSRNPIYPSILFFNGPLPRETFEDLKCNFGDYRP
jgi:hypothetical protein